MIGENYFAASIEEGIAKKQGVVGIVQPLGATPVNSELGFEIVLGTTIEIELGTTKGPEDNLVLNTFQVNEESIQVHGK